MPKRDVRAEILTAAERLAIERGFGGVTTKEVARAAGCSEGSIYNHFRDRSDLLAQVVAARVIAVSHNLGQTVATKPATRGELVAGLVGAVSGAYGQLIALSTSLVADPEVRARFNEVLEEHRAPESVNDAVAAVITTGQGDGLVRVDVDARAVALLFTGPCHQAALHAHLAGEADGPPADVQRVLCDTLETLLDPA